MKDNIITIIVVIAVLTIIGAWSIWITPIAIGILIGVELFGWIGAIIASLIVGVFNIKHEKIKGQEEKQRDERLDEFMRMLEKKMSKI